MYFVKYEISLSLTQNTIIQEEFLESTKKKKKKKDFIVKEINQRESLKFFE